MRSRGKVSSPEPDFLNEDDYFENTIPGTRSIVLLCSDIAQWLKQAASREHASIT